MDMSFPAFQQVETQHRNVEGFWIYGWVCPSFSKLSRNSSNRNIGKGEEKKKIQDYYMIENLG